MPRHANERGHTFPQKQVAIAIWKQATLDGSRLVANQSGVRQSIAGAVVMEVCEAVIAVILPMGGEDC